MRLIRILFGGTHNDRHWVPLCYRIFLFFCSGHHGMYNIINYDRVNTKRKEEKTRMKYYIINYDRANTRRGETENENDRLSLV